MNPTPPRSYTLEVYSPQGLVHIDTFPLKPDTWKCREIIETNDALYGDLVTHYDEYVVDRRRIYPRM